MTHFFIPMLTAEEINVQLEKIGTIQDYGEGSKQFTFTEGHKREYALQKYYDPDYIFNKDTRPYQLYSDIPELEASVKSPNCTLAINKKYINDVVPIETAIFYYLESCISTTYFIVLKPKKWLKPGNNEYAVIELNKSEMKKLLMEYAVIDRDSRSHQKNCLRLKRTDDVIAKWFLLNR